MGPWQVAWHAGWLFLPCYVANMAPVAAARLLPGRSRPLDGGRRARDGRRLLGPHKTWRGVAAGVLGGAATTFVLALVADPGSGLGFGRTDGAPLSAVVAFGAVLGAATLAGDAAKSYVKRRLGRDSGSPWPPFDQMDIVPAALLGVLAGAPLLGGWAMEAYFGDPWVVATFVLATPALHYLSSLGAFAVRLKPHPW